MMIMGAFDLLKYKGLDKTTSVVLCLIVKLFLVIDKLETGDRINTEIFVSY
jgi:hypothetical protein